MNLIYTSTGLPVAVGDKAPTPAADLTRSTFVVSAFRPPFVVLRRQYAYGPIYECDPAKIGAQWAL